MEKEKSVLVVQLIKLDDIIGKLSSNVTYSCEEVDLCISWFMENREKLKSKSEPLESLITIKRENENNQLLILESYNINECHNTEHSFIQKCIKKEFYDEISNSYKTEPLVLSDVKNEATNINENGNDIKINYIKEEPVLKNIIKLENESIHNEYKYCDLQNTKDTIDIKENVIEFSDVNSDATSTSLNEDCDKLENINYFDGDTAASVSGEKSFLTYQENVKTLHDGRRIRIGRIKVKNY